MRSKQIILTFFLLTTILCLSIIGAKAQSVKSEPSDNDLYNEIARMDSVLFDAFNKRDVEQFKKMFTEDLEFYHDKGGLTGYDHTIGFLKSTAASGNQLRRDLVKGSLEVYPIPGYGAMEIGAHTFCHMENGKQDCGTFQFVQIWQKKDGQWKITRVVSYGH
jgi:Domain of unknown function (DUF4440)